MGGGRDRESAARLFADYVKSKAIDKDLEIAPRVSLSLHATLDGDRVNVEALLSGVGAAPRI